MTTLNAVSIKPLRAGGNVDETFQFLIRHGYTVLFVWVLAEQLGLPLPATPLLLAAGALAGAGEMNLALAIGLAVLASLLGDVSWYEFGKRREIGRAHV